MKTFKYTCFRCGKLRTTVLGPISSGKVCSLCLARKRAKPAVKKAFSATPLFDDCKKIS